MENALAGHDYLQRVYNGLTYSSRDGSGSEPLKYGKFPRVIPSDCSLRLLICHELYRRLWSYFQHIDSISPPKGKDTTFAQHRGQASLDVRLLLGTVNLKSRK